jgi:hypothetical protein
MGLDKGRWGTAQKVETKQYNRRVLVFGRIFKPSVESLLGKAAHLVWKCQPMFRCAKESWVARATLEPGATSTTC